MDGTVRVSRNEAGDVYLIVNNESPLLGVAQAIMSTVEAEVVIEMLEETIAKVNENQGTTIPSP